ncbi:LysM peptidoglycan-binding domain-containing protein [Promicromonospora sp. NPDC050249]|uniref:LysM peptidoglycan-binding domain-containing protein n=1 Tax=Promicromonospora sp. NPDC050249 TaxID=3154743 RepID=UPI0033F2A755
MGDVIPLRQYTPTYEQAYVPSYGRAYAPAAGPAAVRAYTPAEGRTLADRLGLAGLRLTRRGRVVLVLLAMLLLAPMVTWGATAVASSPGEPTEVRVHAVQPGETLWGFAQEVARPGEDVRHAVGRLQELNEMSTGTLRVGELLLLPKE